MELFIHILLVVLFFGIPLMRFIFTISLQQELKNFVRDVKFSHFFGSKAGRDIERWAVAQPIHRTGRVVCHFWRNEYYFINGPFREEFLQWLYKEDNSRV